jgi:hypothetical protein
MLGGFILLPIQHAINASRLYSIAYQLPQRVAKVTSQTARLLALFSIGYFAYLFLGSRWATYAHLLAPVAGLLVAEELGKRLYGIPVDETLLWRKPPPFQYRNMSQQIVYMDAMEYYAKKRPEEKVFTESFLLGTIEDPITRATVIATYVEDVAKNGWLAIGRERAKRHELYYDHPPLRTFVIAWVLMFMILIVVQIGEAFGPATIKENYVMPVRVVAAFLFGAAFAPTQFLSSDKATTLAALLMWVPILYLYGWRWLRIIITAILACYFYFSITMLPLNIESWNALPMVQNIQYAISWLVGPALGPIFDKIMDWASGGRYSLGVQAYQVSQKFTLAAIVGFSVALWLRFFLKFNYHIWFSEAGRVYFDRKMRKPQI